MLPITLNTNEVKNAAGAEVEFARYGGNERSLTFSQINESPALPHRLSIKHTETGVGLDKRRRSVVRMDKTITGQVDATKPATISFYVVADIPVGNMTSYAAACDPLAELLSFCASLGASTTILYDCTGNGAATLVNGTL